MSIEPRSSIEGCQWPPLVTGLGAELLALVRQLERTERWAPARLLSHQLAQARLLLAHAARHVPFHAQRLSGAGVDPSRELTVSEWQRVPILTRSQVRTLGPALVAQEVPPSHGELSAVSTGGSSGVPVRITKTALDGMFWSAIHLREELWHREYPQGSLLRLRRVPAHFSPAQAAQVRSPDGLTLPNWGAPTHALWDTGPLTLLDDRVPIPEQVALIRRLQPDYLVTFPANLRLLLAHFRTTEALARPLRAVWTMSEVVDPDLRAACREHFGCRIVDNYTSAECGYLALQCPTFEHFHVQAEAVLLEVLDADHLPCKPGEVGKVVVTPLHNFATPLLRYELGDEAEVGDACPCGRGLPVLRRIVGRGYDYLTLPNGTRRRVDSGHYRICAVPAVREFQLVQPSTERITLKLVLARPLTEAERATILDVLHQEFGTEFHFDLEPVEAIERTEAGKLKSFVSRVNTRAERG